MKSFSILSIAVSLIVIGTSFVFMPSKNAGSPAKGQPAAMTMIPDSLQKVFQKACLDCHSDDGVAMARSHLNFSGWDSYKAEKQADKASAICKVLSKGNMPPKHFKAEYPEVLPTDAQVESICKWASSLKK